LKLHSVLVLIGFQRIDCDYSVYVYLDKLAQGGASGVEITNIPARIPDLDVCSA